MKLKFAFLLCCLLQRTSGASRNAPGVLGIGARVPDFTASHTGSGSVPLLLVQ